MASRRMAVGTAAWRPVLSAGGPCRCRSTSVHGASRVAGHEIAPAMYMPPVPYAAGAVSVAPRPAERRCRSALLGRGWERPPTSACLDRHRAGWRCTSPSPRRYGVSPSQQSPCGEGGPPEVKIPAGSHVSLIRTARSAFPAVVLDLAGPCRESGKIGTEWRDSPRPPRHLHRGSGKPLRARPAAAPRRVALAIPVRADEQ